MNGKLQNLLLSLNLMPVLDGGVWRVMEGLGKFARTSGFAILTGLPSHRFLMHLPSRRTETSQYS
jgi:hypothetical protein